MQEGASDSREGVREVVRQKYGAAAKIVLEARGKGSCCETCGCADPMTQGLYSADEVANIPADALYASLGCGNPTALAALNPGDVVLDLGSGGGIDVLIAAKRVGPTGFVYGLDMTDEMLALAERNRAQAGIENVKFLKGQIEEIPLPDNAVDVIISNCVINLSTDKDAVLREAFRVLKPGGRFAVSDVVWKRPVPAEVRRNVELWAGCVAGALPEAEYLSKLAAAGFVNATITPTRVYTGEDAAAFLGGDCCGQEDVQTAPFIAADAIMSAFIRAEKPAV